MQPNRIANPQVKVSTTAALPKNAKITALDIESLVTD